MVEQCEVGRNVLVALAFLLLLETFPLPTHCPARPVPFCAL